MLLNINTWWLPNAFGIFMDLCYAKEFNIPGEVLMLWRTQDSPLILDFSLFLHCWGFSQTGWWIRKNPENHSRDACRMVPKRAGYKVNPLPVDLLRQRKCNPAYANQLLWGCAYQRTCWRYHNHPLCHSPDHKCPGIRLSDRVLWSVGSSCTVVVKERFFRRILSAPLHFK